MKERVRKILSLMLVVSVILGGAVLPARETKAEDTDLITYMDADYTASAGTPFEIPKFTLESSQDFSFCIYLSQKTDFSITLSVAGKSKTLSAEDADRKENAPIKTYNHLYIFFCRDMSRNATCKMSITFPQDTAFGIKVLQTRDSSYMNVTSATITEGFSTTLSVLNNTESLTWSSSKTSVATVSDKGVVKGKKEGTAIITAKAASGAAYTCTIKVAKNVYTNSVSFSNVSRGNAIVDVTKVSYDSKGNLVIKAKAFNNTGKKVVALKNLKITVLSGSGKSVGVYSLKKKKVTISNGGTKNFTFKIKKSKLKLKKTQDLRKASYKTRMKTS
ncbi:MAG: Ig-like domain-containing protein [Lachnospiraceae bacterium]|nr:Ig-like domain-containing protein [Lachnospiraceae bacterium]